MKRLFCYPTISCLRTRLSAEYHIVVKVAIGNEDRFIRKLGDI